MSSPPRRITSNSPIRNLDQKSPQLSRKLHTIMEQSLLQNRSRGYMSQNSHLMMQNQVLAQKMRIHAHQSNQFLIQNSRLRKENDLKQKNYLAATLQYDRLHKELILKDGQLQKLNNDMSVLKNHYQRDLQQARVENESLRQQVVLLERKNYSQVAEIKDRYNAMVIQDSSLTRKAYSQDLKKVVIALQSTKALLSEKQLQLNHLASLSQKFSKQYSMNLQQLVSENNQLRNKILTTQINKNNQVRQAQIKKQLQKSRTNGILNFCKQNNAFIEKQVNKLAGQLLQKNISIDGSTKQIIKQKKNQQHTEKKYENKIQRLQQNYIDKIRQMEQLIKKSQKHQKEQIGDMKKIQMDLIEKIAKLQHQKDTILRQLDHTNSVLHQKINQLQQSRNNVAKLHQQHAKQVSKIMIDSRIKRKSLRNLSSSISSLRQLQAQGVGVGVGITSSVGVNSSLINSSTIKKQQPMPNISLVQKQQNNSKALHIVPEQMANSQLVAGDDDNDDVDMRELVLHYEQKIHELKRHFDLEQTLWNEKLEKLNQSLRKKQQQVLQLLQRFSPLMQFKLNPGSLEAQRKQKIEKHYKADIDILSVMLQKYQIVALKK